MVCQLSQTRQRVSFRNIALGAARGMTWHWSTDLARLVHRSATQDNATEFRIVFIEIAQHLPVLILLISLPLTLACGLLCLKASRTSENA